MSNPPLCSLEIPRLAERYLELSVLSEQPFAKDPSQSVGEYLTKSCGADARVVATGGLAQLISSECSSVERVEPYLTLEGLRIIFEKNRPQASEIQKERSA